MKDADALIIRSDKATAEVFEAAKNLKIIVRAGAGYDNIDLAAATAHKVVAGNTPGQMQLLNSFWVCLFMVFVTSTTARVVLN